MKSILILALALALALLTVSAGTDWGMPLISGGTCYERCIQYGTAMEQQVVPYQIGMSEITKTFAGDSEIDYS